MMIAYTKDGINGPVTCTSDVDPSRVAVIPPGPQQAQKIAEFFAVDPPVDPEA
jgi:hypothetical protein